MTARRFVTLSSQKSLPWWLVGFSLFLVLDFPARLQASTLPLIVGIYAIHSEATERSQS
jgi:hypothetical protein